MATLWNRAGHYILPCGFFLLSFFFDFLVSFYRAFNAMFERLRDVHLKSLVIVELLKMKCLPVLFYIQLYSPYRQPEKREKRSGKQQKYNEKVKNSVTTFDIFEMVM